MSCERCSSLLPGQVLKVGQGLVILLAVFEQDVQVPFRLLGCLRDI